MALLHAVLSIHLRADQIIGGTAIKAGLWELAFVVCNTVMQAIKSAAGIRNVYNVKAGCPFPPLCYDFSAATTLLNTHDIQVALGVPNGLQWQSCNFEVNG